MIFEQYSTALKHHLEKTDTTLPISDNALSRLMALVPPGERMILMLRDNLYCEEIEIMNQCGQILIVGRGLGGTEAKVFPRGTELKFEVTPSVVREIVCSHDCCETPCPEDPVAAAGVLLPPARTGIPWDGTMVFTGSLPIMMGAQLPPWVTASNGANYVKLSGTPPGPGEYLVIVTGSNMKGHAGAIQSGTITVSY